MIVLYLKESDQFLQAIMGFPEVREEGNKLLLASGKVIINDLTKAGYREYPDQEYRDKIPMEEDEEGFLIEQSITVAELELRDFTAEELAEVARVVELLSSSPAVISQPEMWELMRIFGRKLGYKFEDT